MICLNRAAARCVSVGDKVILMAYAQVTPQEIQEGHHPAVVFVDEENRVTRVTNYEKHGLLREMPERPRPRRWETTSPPAAGGWERTNHGTPARKVCTAVRLWRHCRLQNPQRGLCPAEGGGGGPRGDDPECHGVHHPLDLRVPHQPPPRGGHFDRNFPYDIHHISPGHGADLILIAPATADVIAKLAHGIADDMLTTVVLAAKCKKLVAPAMNTAMLENPITQDNLKTLERYGFQIIPPDSGLLACQAVGGGKMPEPGGPLGSHRPGAGPAQEPPRGAGDGDRRPHPGGPGPECASSPTTALAGWGMPSPGRPCSGGPRSPWSPAPPACPLVPFVDTRPVTTAADMFRAVQDLLPQTDILIKAAAVADYRPATVAQDKMKKSDDALSIPLARTDDILGWVAQHRHPGLFVCGFSMETGTWWPTPGPSWSASTWT